MDANMGANMSNSIGSSANEILSNVIEEQNQRSVHNQVAFEEGSEVQINLEGKMLTGENEQLLSLGVGKIIEVLENNELMGYFSAEIIRVEALHSQNCNTLDIHTAFYLKTEGLDRIYQFGHYGPPYCKTGYSMNIFLFSGDETVY